MICRTQLRALYGRLRDLGSVALELRSSGGRQRLLMQQQALTVRGVRASLLSLAEMVGTGCEARKAAMLTRLLRASSGSETK